MTRLTPILNLGQVYDLVIGQQGTSTDLFHSFGIFVETKRLGERYYYVIYDEHKKIEIKLGGKISEYDSLSPKNGDIVRFHRLRINSDTHEVQVTLAKDVVVWPGFQDDPKPRHIAKRPTINEDDNKRRKVLEKYFCTRRSKLIDLSRARIEPENGPGRNCYDVVAGRFDKRAYDLFDHADLSLSDGSGVDMKLKVFRPRIDNKAEVDNHFDIARHLYEGQYVVATNVKLRENKDGSRILNLSANFWNGRSFSIVEPMSELGEELGESIDNYERAQCEQIAPPPVIPNLPRRSPRFLNGESASNIPAADTSNSEQVQPSLTLPEFPPPFTRHNEIRMPTNNTGRDVFRYYNILGMVRGEASLTSNYGNCVVQIYDGSRPVYPNYFRYEVKEPIDECIIVYIYCKQSEFDTDEHFNNARSVKEGDLVYLTNVKVTFKGEPVKMRAELNANKSHSKSFNVIDRDSIFGREILRMIGSPDPNPDIPKTDQVLESINQHDESLDEDDRILGEENPY